MLCADFLLAVGGFPVGNPGNHLADIDRVLLRVMHERGSVFQVASDNLLLYCRSRPRHGSCWRGMPSCPVSTNRLIAGQRGDRGRVGAQYARAKGKFQTVLQAVDPASFGRRKPALRPDHDGGPADGAGISKAGNGIGIRITGAGLKESHVHDVQITRESPNYRMM